MSGTHTARNSRKKEIPQAFILNWQCPGTQGSKPLVRRPMTACEACRMAKVKCNGKQECDRCSSRGTICRYTPANRDHQKGNGESAIARNRRISKRTPPSSSSSSSSSSTNRDSPLNLATTRNLQIQAEAEPYLSPESTGEEVPLDVIEPFGVESAADFAHGETNDPVMSLPHHQAIEKFNWEPLVDMNQNVCCCCSGPPSEQCSNSRKGFVKLTKSLRILLRFPPKMEGTRSTYVGDVLQVFASSSPSTAESSSIDFDILQSFMKLDHPMYADCITPQPMTMHGHHHSESSLGSLSDIDTTSLLSSLDDGRHNYSPSSLYNHNCRCQANLMLRVPDVKCVMEEKPEPRLDKVFKVTGDVIQSCQDIINCATCEISHADLVCIMAVFQHTDKCFDYIAQCDLANAFIQVSVGEYHVSLTNDLKLRRMLVMDLVQKARALLCSLSSLGQKLGLSQPGASRLNQINLEYLQEVVQNSESCLRKITASFDSEILS